MEFKSLDCQGISRRKCKEKKNKFKDKMENNNLERVRGGQENRKT